jgi:hypothetical protein
MGKQGGDDEKSGNFIKNLGDEIKKSLSFEAVNEQAKTLYKSVNDVVKEIGVGRENAYALTVELGDSEAKITALGGSLQDAVNIQKEFFNATNQQAILSSQILEDVFETSKALGASTSTFIKSFEVVGGSIEKFTDNMTQVSQIAASFGVNAKAVSSDVLNNIDLLDNYDFSNGVEGLASMASTMSQLKYNLDDVEKVTNALLDPSKALNFSQKMASLGSQNRELTDNLNVQMMALENPEKLMKNITEEFAKFYQKQEDGTYKLSKQGLLLMGDFSQAAGISSDKLRAASKEMLEAKDKMSQITLPTLESDEDTKNYISQMSKIGKDGKAVITFEAKDERGMIEKVTKTLDELTTSDAEMLKLQMEEQAKKTAEEKIVEQMTPEEREKALRDSISAAIKNGFATTKVVQGAIELKKDAIELLLKPLSSAIDSSSIRKAGDTVATTVADLGVSIKKFVKGQSDLSGAFDGVKSSATVLEGIMSGQLKKGLETLDESLSKINIEDYNQFGIVIKEITGKKTGDLTELRAVIKDEVFTMNTKQKDAIISNGVVVPYDEGDVAAVFKERGSEMSIDEVKRSVDTSKTPAQDFVNQYVGTVNKTENIDKKIIEGEASITVNFKADNNKDIEYQLMEKLKDLSFVQEIKNRLNGSLMEKISGGLLENKK